MSKHQRSMALIENIYFSIKFHENYNEWIGNNIEKFNYFQSTAYTENNKFLQLGKDEYVEIIGGVQRYPFGFGVKNKYRIYFSSKISDNYEVYVIVSAQYMHTHNVFQCINVIQNTLEQILNIMDDSLHITNVDYKLSRIDICNHNNFIDLFRYIKPTEYNSRVVTKLRTVQPFVHLNGDDDQETNYFRYGSGDCVVRFYNKVREICQQQEKAFFFQKWLDNDLIDKHTFDIYEHTYKLNNNYRIDFIFSNIYFSELSEEIKSRAQEIYVNKKIESDERYDILNSILKKAKIKCAHEIVNVEFQLRNGFLKTVKSEDLDGNVIDYTDMINLLEHTEDLYKHLTERTFRVIVKQHDTKRKRDKLVDPLWKLIQNSHILNITDLDIDNDKLEFYRLYNTTMSEIHTTKKIVKSLAHLYYLNNDYIEEDIENIDLDKLILNLYGPYSMNESFYNIKEFLLNQLRYYGKKKK